MLLDCLLLLRRSTRLRVALEQQRCGVGKMREGMWVEYGGGGFAVLSGLLHGLGTARSLAFSYWRCAPDCRGRCVDA